MLSVFVALINAKQHLLRLKACQYFAWRKEEEMLKSRVGEGWSTEGEKPRNLAATCRMLTDFIGFFDEKENSLLNFVVP